MACALVSPCGHVELFQSVSNLNVNDVLQEPIHTIALRGFRLFFSSAAFFSSEVNEFASGFAQQLIKGDACLVHDQHQHLLDCLLQSKQLRITQAVAPSNSSSSSHGVLVSTFDDHSPTHIAMASSVLQPGCCEADSPLVLNQPQRLSRITAANNTRQRILRSMSATGVSTTLPTAVPAARTPISVPAASMTHQPSSSSVCSESTLYSSSCDSPGTNSSSSCRAGSIGHMPRSAEGMGAVHPSKARSTLPFYATHSKSNIISSSGSSNTHVKQVLPHPYAQQQCRESFHHRLNAAAADDAAPMDLDHTHQHPHKEAHGLCLLQQQQPCVHYDHAQPVADTAAAPVAPGPSLAAAVSGSGVSAGLCLWGDIPVEVMAQVARFMGSTVAAVMPICMACRSWRQAVLEDDQLLQGLTFRLNTPPTHTLGHRHSSQHPALLERAAKLGNVSALVVRARLLDAGGCPDEAMRCWRRAAKAGHLEGQLLYGLALYRGTAGVAPDAEDAHLWLSKALKQVLASKQDCGSSSGGKGTTSSSSSPGAVSASSSPPSRGLAESTPVSADSSGTSSSHVQSPVVPCCAALAAAAASRQQCGLVSRVLSQAGLVLGYLSFDGEGTRTDKQEAVRCFKLASHAGCKEAQQVLGWIFNTGQY